MKSARQPAKTLKVLVFAHTPPPYHGQSVMVEALLCGLQSDPRFEVYHVNARLSDDMEDIGSLRLGKFFRLAKYIAQALWIRGRHGAMAFYYIPAPVKKSAILRDWVVMAFCRPVFSRLILHWHAWGLASWCRQGAGVARWLTHQAISGADTSIVLSAFQIDDAQKLFPASIQVVPNGIEDPCPDFIQQLSNVRTEFFNRIQTSKSGLFRILFLAHCTEAKGLFLALNAVAILKALLPDSNIRFQVAGSFVSTEENQHFHARIIRPDLLDSHGLPIVQYLGFCEGVDKIRLFQESDLFIFPTSYPEEVQPVNLIEAMAFGLPIVATAWRGIPEMLPKDYPLTKAACPAEELVHLVLNTILTCDRSLDLRNHYEQNFRLVRHVELMKKSLAI